MGLDPDHPQSRRRALAARVATLAGSVEIAIAGCVELHAPVPPEAYAVPALFRRWAAAIQATRP